MTKKDIRKVTAGYARSNYYHTRNMERLVDKIREEIPQNPKIVEKVVKATYQAFKKEFKFFKKN